MIGVFIGSFNPITSGHLLIAQTMLEHSACTHIMFVPVSDLYKKDTLNVTAQQRVEMIQLAISDYDNMSVNTIEIDIAKSTGYQNKTIETMRLLQKEYQDKLMFIVGADNVSKLHTWYEAESLVQEFGILVISRDGIDVETLIQNDEWLSKHVSFYDVVDEAMNSASSSQIRQAIKENLPISGLVCDKVEQYIKEHRLYVEVNV